MKPTPKNKILSVGCSNTVGWDLEEEIGIFDYNPQPQDIKTKADLYRTENNFSTLISNHFNRECINIGRGGSSNARIIYSMIDYIDENPNIDFVLINLTGQSRNLFSFRDELVDVDFKYEPKHIFYYPRFKDYPLDFKKRYKKWFEFYRDELLTNHELNVKQEHLIRYAIEYLKNRNIKFFISKTIDMEFDISFQTPYTIKESFEECNIREGRPRAKGNHWLSDSHKRWSEILIDEIKKHKLVTV